MAPKEVFENIKSLVVPNVNLNITPKNPVTKFSLGKFVTVGERICF